MSPKRFESSRRNLIIDAVYMSLSFWLIIILLLSIFTVFAWNGNVLFLPLTAICAAAAGIWTVYRYDFIQVQVDEEEMLIYRGKKRRAACSLKNDQILFQTAKQKGKILSMGIIHDIIIGDPLKPSAVYPCYNFTDMEFQLLQKEVERQKAAIADQLYKETEAGIENSSSQF